MEMAQKYVWEGAIPLQIHLHHSEVTSHPPPPAALVLAPRVSYLPLLLPLVKPHFATTLPPGIDTIWFEYKGLPLKWYIPTGVLFDLLCAEPERPWNLTVHFRSYPSNALIPCDGEDSVKWNFMNSLKEADYIVNGNCKNVMHMSQSDQTELWQSVLNANLDAYQKASIKLKLGFVEDVYPLQQNLQQLKAPKANKDGDSPRHAKAEKIPIRLYVRHVNKDFEELEEMAEVDSWDQVSYINRPLDFCREEGRCFTLNDALKALLPELLSKQCTTTREDAHDFEKDKTDESSNALVDAELKLWRIQGIQPKLEIPFSWLANNLKHPEHFLHICLFVKLSHTTHS